MTIDNIKLYLNSLVNKIIDDIVKFIGRTRLILYIYIYIYIIYS